MKEKPLMSLWGVGPRYVVGSILAFAAAFYFHMLTYPLFSIRPLLMPFFIVTAVLVTMAGLSLWIPAALKVDDIIRAGKMATRGVYGVVRNPIYAGILLVLTGICLSFCSYLLLAVPILSYLQLKRLLNTEEETMLQQFGSDYETYRQQVNAILPDPRCIADAFFYPAKTQHIEQGLYCMRDDDVNLYVYRKDGHTILIDSGYHQEKVIEGLASFGMHPQDIEAVFLTHSDGDHTGGIDAFSHATLYMGAGEEVLVDGVKRRLFFLKNRPIRREFSLLADGDQVNCGGIAVKAVATHGHTCGHTCYLVDEKYLFCGDALLEQNGSFRTLYRLLNMDQQQAQRSLEKILQITDVALYCAAHSGSSVPLMNENDRRLAGR